ncbi:MAG: hypothetical protein H6729_06180 [Deltaproteobacteria bacterium]|nr:hypothetical protein [Deltaproteobacteria bacterium]
MNVLVSAVAQLVLGLLLGLVGMASSGCLDVEVLGLPTGSNEDGAVLLVAIAPGDSPRIFAVDPLRPDASGVSLRPEDRLLALVFRDTLDAMGLSPGLQVVRGYARPLPFPFDVYEASVSSVGGDAQGGMEGAVGRNGVGDGSGASSRRTWRSRRVAEVQSIVDAIRLPSFGPEDCESRSGCFRIQPDANGRLDAYCEVPCQRPDVPDPGNVEVPLLPRMQSDACPLGWLAEAPRSAEDVSACAPAARSGCPAGQVQFGDAGGACSTVDEDEALCPDDGWPSADRLDPSLGSGSDVVFVDVSALGGEVSPNGSKDHPFVSLAAALGSATPSSTVAVRVGTYVEDLVIADPVRIVGACAAGVVLRGLRATGPAVRIAPGGRVDIEGVSIQGEQQALLVDGPVEANLRAVDVSVRSGPGVVARGSVRLSMVRSVVGPAKQYGVYFENTPAESSTTTEALALELEDVVIRGVQGDALSLRGAGVHAALADVVVEGSRALNNLRGKGLEVLSGAQVEIARSLFEDNAYHDVSVSAGGQVTLEDVWIRGGSASSASEFGFGCGLEVGGGGRIAAQRLNVEGKRYGVYVGRGGAAALEDVRVLDTADIGVVVRDGGSLEGLIRAVVLNARRAGIDVLDAPATFEDVTVARTRAVAVDDDGYCSVHEYEKGAGLRVRGASRVRGHGVAVVEVEGAGITVGNRQPNRIGGGAILPSCNDSFVEDVALSDVRVERSVVGVGSYFGAATFQNLALSENRVAGIDLALGRLDVSDAVILGTDSSAGLLLSTRFPHANDGRLGVSVLQRLRLAHHAAGIRIDDPNDAYVEASMVEDNAIGLQILQAGFDRHALRTSIAYRHNRRLFEE